MGCRNGEELPYVEEASFSDALLFATMCIVGLPVDVHARDGSIYSGIFHTASVEGVVLKKAKMTKKGKSNPNVSIGCMVETLVVLSSDLVQVVAKGVLLPADGVIGNIVGDELESTLGKASSRTVDRIGNESYASTMSKRRTYQKRTSVQAENGLTHGDTDISELILPRANGNEGKWILKHDMRSTMEEENVAKRVQTVNNKGKDDSAPSSNVRRSAFLAFSPCLSRQPSLWLSEIIGDPLPFNGESPPDASSTISILRLTKDDKQVLDDGERQSELHTAEVHNSSLRGVLQNPSGDEIIGQGKPDEGTHGKVMPPENLNGASLHSASAFVVSEDQPTSADGTSNVISPSMSTSPSPRADLTSQYCHSSHLQGVDSNKKTKEFKLNPGAKVFSPTFGSSSSATPLVQTVAGVTYMPNTSPMSPAQTEVGIGPLIPHSTVHLKVLPYTGIGDVYSHPEPVARAPPFRYSGQHQTVPLGSTFVHLNSQPVMVGQLGQVMYMPLPQDLVQNAAAISPAFTRPLSAINQVPFLKQQAAGNLPGQPLLHPPSLTGVQQLYPTPSPMLLMQPPVLANRAVAVPGPNSLYPAKFS